MKQPAGLKARFSQCGLCGALVKKLEKQGYCEQCRLLIEALIDKKPRKEG